MKEIFTKQTYFAPQVDYVEIITEAGFALSVPSIDGLTIDDFDEEEW